MAEGKRITKRDVWQGYCLGIIRIEDAEKHLGDGICAAIGEGWFYFAGHEGELETPGSYKRNVPKKEIVRDIHEALQGIRDLDEDEYEYYRLFLEEALAERRREE